MNEELGERKIYLLDSDRLDFYWPQIAPLLAEVPMFGELYDLDLVLEQAKMGHYQVWALSDGAIRCIVVTQINSFPKASVLQVLAASGNQLMEFFDVGESTLEWIAKTSGCDFIQGICRPGLARKLRGRATKVGFVMMKQIHKEGVQ